jgi:energy-coupling factor transport system ATP-binding protein
MEVIDLRDYSYAYSEAGEYVLKGINLKIEAGQCHCITGHTGSGKTTLALAIKGLLPPGKEAGEIACGRSPDLKGADVGIVLQNPETQLLAFTIGAEAAFGLESLCVDPASMPEKVEKVLSRVGLDKPIDFETHKLSMGEKYRLILASQLIMDRNFFVLDEPAGQLDPDGLERLLRIIQDLKRAGIAFLLLENRPEPLSEAIDSFWHLTGDGMVRPGREIMNADRSRSPILSSIGEREFQDSRLRATEEVVGVSGLTVQRSDGKSIWSDLSMSVSRGRRAVIHGENGAGKTTLLRCLMGFIAPSKGVVSVLGQKPVPGKLRGKVGCLFQNPEKQIFESTVFEEIAFPLKRLGATGEDLRTKVMEVLKLFGIEGLSEFSPHRLSYGQKHLVALASVFAPEPELLILDDPLAGLDRVWCETISDLLSSVNGAYGTTIIVTSHDPAQLQGWADLVLCLNGGKFVVQ